MGPKPSPILKNEPKKNILIAPSKVINRPDNLEGGEETEIAANISIPQDGGWGWIVLAASFICLFILDGVVLTFGSLIDDITKDLQISDSAAAVMNSIAMSVYFVAGPLASAFINRFGFRATIMSGSILSSYSLFISYFGTGFINLCLFYGGFAGFGYCLINMAANLVVGFYFEKLRSLAIAIATCGSSIGVMVFSPVNTYLVSLAGWRNATLLHCGLIGSIYFFGMSFQPVLSLTVTNTTDDPTRTVTYLPNLSAPVIRKTDGTTTTENLKPSPTERLFSAVSNVNFPTVAAVVDDNNTLTSTTQPGPSTAPVSKLTLTTNAPQGGISKRQLKQVQSIISKTSVQDKTKIPIEVTVHVEDRKDSGCCGNLCRWEKHIPQSRPMYRDDAFYDGKLDKLPIYQKSKMDTTGSKTGLEYHLAVTRAATAVDMKEQRGVFTTAARRILATMMDPKLLKKKSFRFLCVVGFLIYVGLLVPYVFIISRNVSKGLGVDECSLLVSVIGLSNAVGRLVLGAIACKVDPFKVYMLSILMSGVSTVASDFSYNIYYQYGYCFVFGFCTSSVNSLRSTVIVAMYGLENLTNATGIILLFQGVGSLFGTPVAGLLKNNFGYSSAFYVAGFFMSLGALILVYVKILSEKEEKEEKLLTVKDANGSQKQKLTSDKV